jgi:anti-sigma regulatory factor (Ser/Thr protein kinase)
MVPAMAVPSGGHLELPLINAEALAEVRRTLAGWLEPLVEDSQVVDDIVWASTELCSNALRAAESKAVIRARTVGKSVLIEVVDDGDGISGDIPETAPAPYSESGRGLFLVRQLVDVLWIRKLPEGGTRAMFAKRLRGAI